MPIPADTWRWLTTGDGQQALAAAPTELTAASISRLRKRYSADESHAIVECAQARTKATRKLDSAWAGHLIADTQGVEMASSMYSSAYKARRYRLLLGEDSTVGDLCCGIGADSWGLVNQQLRVVGVDQSESRCVMFAHNLPQSEVICGDALDDCPEIDAFHLDPARREGDRRSRNVDSFLPPVDVWRKLISRVPSGAIKLNPGVNAGEIPDGELEVISEAGSLTQALLWTGVFEQHVRTATRLYRDVAVSVSGVPERPDEQHDFEAFVGTLDPSLERAELVGELLRLLGVSLVHPGTGLVTAAEPNFHAMVRWYRVLDVLPWNEKRVRVALRAHDTGTVEVRTRAGLVNPDELQRRLRGTGERQDISVLIYRLGDRQVAVIAEQHNTKISTGVETPMDIKGGDDES